MEQLLARPWPTECCPEVKALKAVSTQPRCLRELGHPLQACPVPCLYAEEGLKIRFLPLVRGWFCNPYFLLWLSMEVFFSKFDPEGMTEKMVGDGGVLVLLVHFAFKKKCKFLLSGFTFSLSFTSAGIVWKKCKIQPSV